MGNDLQKGTVYDDAGLVGARTVNSTNLNAHVDEAIIKSTFVSGKSLRSDASLTDAFVVEASGVLYRETLQQVYDLMVDSIIVPGSIIQIQSAVYNAYAALSTEIPMDDTIPQISEGTQILSVTITPR